MKQYIKTKILIMILIMSTLLGAVMLSTRFGTTPNKLAKDKFNQSKQYNSEKGIFENRIPDILKKMKEKSMNLETFVQFLKGNEKSKPVHKLPEIKPDLTHFMREDIKSKVIWFGHSTFLLKIKKSTILVDPVFSNSASPISLMVKRFQKPVLELTELPKIDFILISHDHYDHLDMESIKFFKKSETIFITPLGVGSHLEGWGISKDKIIEKDWWESVELSGIEFIATPAQHFSGRNGFNDNETLWASWVIRNENERIYFSGDSGYDIHFKEIGDRFGPFDIAFLENGQYNEKWEEVHMLPEQTIMAFKDLRAIKLFPVHWGMFVLSIHSWFEPIQKIKDLSEKESIEVLTPKFGEIVDLNNLNIFTNWWESSI